MNKKQQDIAYFLSFCTAQYYNADLAKIDLQYQQSHKKGGKDEDQPETVAEA